jgi:TnpA family transposase
VRDATHVLDGLLYHESDLKIEEHYTDTAGFTDHVFALCHLLGFRFAPRIRDLADKRLYVPGKAGPWPSFFNRLGEIRDRSFENQRYRASGLNLVVLQLRFGILSISNGPQRRWQELGLSIRCFSTSLLSAGSTLT